jgi:hypothetical protein
MAEIGLQGPRIDALGGQGIAAGMRSMCGCTLNPILASSPARASSLANPDGVNGPPRSEAKTKGEVDWRLSSRSAANSSPRIGWVAAFAAFSAPHVHGPVSNAIDNIAGRIVRRRAGRGGSRSGS